MLQAVSNGHDLHHERTERNSAAAVEQARSDGKIHLLLAASGSVATIKLPNLVRALGRHPDVSIRVVLTASAARFLGGQAAEQPTVSVLAHLPGVEAVYVDADEWEPAWRRGSPILHISLRRWADVMVVAPLSANTLAKVAAGMCDNLLTSVVRAWDTTGLVDAAAGADAGDRPARRRILVAPAMNTAMWRHPVTARHVKVLDEEWGRRRRLVRGPAAHREDARVRRRRRRRHDGVGGHCQHRRAEAGARQGRILRTNSEGGLLVSWGLPRQAGRIGPATWAGKSGPGLAFVWIHVWFVGAVLRCVPWPATWREGFGLERPSPVVPLGPLRGTQQ